MRVADSNSLPIGLHVDSAQPHESVLAKSILVTVEVPQRRCRPCPRPRVLVADKAYDGRRHRRPEQGRPLHTGPIYPRRWKGERCFGWMANYRRLVMRYERYVEHYKACGV